METSLRARAEKAGSQKGGKMTARNLLWLALGTVGLPLLIEGNGGCGFQGTALPIKDNAYTCGCRCDASPVTKTVRIAANSDDAEQDGASVRLGGNDLHLGTNIVGLRFIGVGIPAGATIVSASVQFTANSDDAGATDVRIFGELSTNAQTFAATDNNLSDRVKTVAVVPWLPGPWIAKETGPAERTPELATVVQELVNQAGWTTVSPIALRFDPNGGQRRPIEFSGDPARAAVLLVTFTPSIDANVPVCATPDIVAQNDDNGVIPQAVADADCRGRVTDNLKALASGCGYPTTACTCQLVIPDQGDASFDRDVCEGASCGAVPVDATCSNFNPNGFWDCILAGGTAASCAHFVTANSVPGGAPVCLAVDKTPGMAARLFGNHRTFDVAGTAQIQVGDRGATTSTTQNGTVNMTHDTA